ncbi:MAG: hypothetical protein HOW73_35015 [Polyangiaceae bacterium]|nr:hypothetical protein [Polyangiaceae bacterium]
MNPMSDCPTDKGELLGGLSLEQFAGVTAALAEGFEPGAIFDQEGIDPATWPAAQRAWREAIADAHDLQMQYMQKRRAAEDCLRRPIDPLDDDPDAWLGLLGAMAAAHDAGAVVAELGITMRDIGRLGRAWKAKAARDPELAGQLQEGATAARAPTRLTVGRMRLRPFPWTPAAPDTGLDADNVGPDSMLETTGPVVVPERCLATFQLLEQAPRESTDAHDTEGTLPPETTAPQTLPFGQRRASIPPPPAPIHKQSGDTVVDAGDERDPTLPFERGALGLTMLDRYAELAARLRAAPERSDAIMRELGLDTVERRRRVHELWELRFRANADLRGRFVRLVEEKLASMATDVEMPDDTVTADSLAPLTVLPFRNPAPGRPSVPPPPSLFPEPAVGTGTATLAAPPKPVSKTGLPFVSNPSDDEEPSDDEVTWVDPSRRE